MDNTLSLLGIAGAMAVGAMSPGPSFVMVARTAVASRGDGLAAALGMGLADWSSPSRRLRDCRRRSWRCRGSTWR